MQQTSIVVHRRAHHTQRRRLSESTNEESRLSPLNLPDTYFLYILNELTTYLVAFISWIRELLERDSSVVQRAGRPSEVSFVTPLINTRHYQTHENTHTRIRRVSLRHTGGRGC